MRTSTKRYNDRKMGETLMIIIILAKHHELQKAYALANLMQSKECQVEVTTRTEIAMTAQKIHMKEVQ